MGRIFETQRLFETQRHGEHGEKNKRKKNKRKKNKRKKTRGRKTRGGSEKQEEGTVKKGDMLAMLDAGLYF